MRKFGRLETEQDLLGALKDRCDELSSEEGMISCSLLMRGSDGSEAMAMIAPQGDNTCGTAMILSLMNSFSSTKYFSSDVSKKLLGFHHWSRDLLFLFPRDQSALEAWLDRYHNSPTHRRSTGALQAAIALHITGSSCLNFKHMELLVEGANGLLPNLDLVNSVSKMARYKGLRVSTGERSFIPSVKGLKFMGERMEPLIRMLLRQATSGATANLLGKRHIHAPFLRYRIDAVTLRGRAKRGIDASMRQTFETLEGSIRAMNNLLEHLHQSFFFYLLPGRDVFVSIAHYMPVPVMLSMMHALSFFALHSNGPEAIMSVALALACSFLITLLVQITRGSMLLFTIPLIDCGSRSIMHRFVKTGGKSGSHNAAAFGHLLIAAGVLLLSLTNISLAIVMGLSALLSFLPEKRHVLKRALLCSLFNPVVLLCMQPNRPSDIWNFGIPWLLLYPGGLLLGQ